jgi:hypothetical protein
MDNISTITLPETGIAQFLLDLNTEWQKASVSVAQALEAHYAASTHLTECHHRHDDAVNDILVEHADNLKELGVNEEVRKARIAYSTREFLGPLRAAEAAERKAFHDLEIAKLNRSRIRETRRILCGVEVNTQW